MMPSLPLPARAGLLSLVLVLGASCKSDGPTEPKATVSVSVTPVIASVVAGSTTQLSAAVQNAANTGVSWSSSAPSVATVSGSGLVTGVSAGTALITARSMEDAERSGAAVITVTTAAVPDYTIAVSTPASVERGLGTTATVTITRTNGFTGTVTLAAEGLPTGVTGTFAPATLTGTETTSVLTLATTASTTTGTTSFTVRGTAAGLPDRSGTASLTVTAPAAGFTLAMTPTSATLNQGGTATYTVTATRTGGFTGAIALTATGLPSGVTAAFAPASLSGTTLSSVLTLTASVSATLGTATVAVRGNATGLTERTASASVVVQSAAQPGVALAVNTTAITIGRGQYAWVVPIVSSAGYTGNGTVTASGMPAGVTAGFALHDQNTTNPSAYFSVPGAGNAPFKLVVSAGAALGTSTIMVRATPSNTAYAPVEVAVQLTVVDPQAATSPAWQDLSAGSDRACGIRADGKMYCWGTNVPDRTLTTRWVPTVAAGGLPFTQVSVGGSVACGVTSANKAYCWGADNTFGQLGAGEVSSFIAREPHPVAGNLSFKAVASSNSHSCAITTGGAAYCWGAQFEGALGDGVIATTNSEFRNAPTAVLGGHTFTSIATNTGNSCGLTAAGQAYCWGSNSHGQLGDGTRVTSATPVAVQQGGIAYARIVPMGSLTCAISTQAALYCWGNATHIPGASSNTSYILAPMRIGGTQTYADVDGGSGTRCALTTSGQASCWGSNTYGALGNGGTTDSYRTMVAVAGGHTFTNIDVGGYFTCGVTTAGSMYCWGYGYSGQLGEGATVNRSTPNLVKTF